MFRQQKELPQNKGKGVPATYFQEACLQTREGEGRKLDLSGVRHRPHSF